jgi:hypothetical protein
MHLLIKDDTPCSFGFLQVLRLGQGGLQAFAPLTVSVRLVAGLVAVLALNAEVE